MQIHVANVEDGGGHMKKLESAVCAMLCTEFGNKNWSNAEFLKHLVPVQKQDPLFGDGFWTCHITTRVCSTSAQKPMKREQSIQFRGVGWGE